MQITHCEVIPVELTLKKPMTAASRIGGHPDPVGSITAIFIRLETRQGTSAWGCTVAHPLLTGVQARDALLTCREMASRAVDLHPLNLEYSLSELSRVAPGSDAALCAFDLAFHDLLSLAAGMPLYRLLGGYRNRIQTSITIPIDTEAAGVEAARERASEGFRILKVKGGESPELDVSRIRAIHRALPDLELRLDADGGYTVQQALDVARALQGKIEMLEQPTPPDDLEGLAQVTRYSPIPVLADQSACGLDSALRIGAGHCANGLSVKAATCGGLRSARQVDSIARAAKLFTMVGCLIEPALLVSAGLSLALSSPNVRYGDLDGHLHLRDDPSIPGFQLKEGWLIATDVPGLGYSVNLG